MSQTQVTNGQLDEPTLYDEAGGDDRSPSYAATHQVGVDERQQATTQPPCR